MTNSQQVSEFETLEDYKADKERSAIERKKQLILKRENKIMEMQL